MTFAELLQQAWLMLIGLGVGGGALYLIIYRDAHFWRSLSKVYEAPWQRALETRYFQHAVAYGEGVASKSYNGLLTIGVHELGLALKIVPPFSLFHKPLFIPFSEIKGWKQIWYLNAKSVELEFQSAPEVKLVMPASQVKWLQEKSGGQLALAQEHSPHKQRPNIWYAILIVQAIMAIGLAYYLVLGDWPL